MNAEIRSNATAALESMLASIPGLIPVRVGGRNCYVVDTGVTDEQGRTVYGTFDTSVKNNDPTKTADGFDIAKAIADREEYDAKPKRERKPVVTDPEKEARKAKRDAMQDQLAQWCLTNLTTTPMTTTDIIAQTSSIVGDTPLMFVGSMLKNIAVAYPDQIARTVVRGKTYYNAVA